MQSIQVTHQPLASNPLKKGSWIVDSGASDHMTGSSQFFSSRIPCLGNSKVRIADGSLSTVAGKGTVKLSDCLTLFSVLHVPNLNVIFFQLVNLPRTQAV